MVLLRCFLLTEPHPKTLINTCDTCSSKSSQKQVPIYLKEPSSKHMASAEANDEGIDRSAGESPSYAKR